MRIYTIQSTQNKKSLFEGYFESFQSCLETAVNENIDLSHADLKQKNLCNSNLDDARLMHADFTGANLSGTNLSEARLTGANFSGAALFNTCFAYSDMQHCHFEHSDFGATELTGANLSFSNFAGLSCFSLDFMNVFAMKACTFKDTSGRLMKTSAPPVVILGINTNPIIFMNEQIEANAQTLVN